MKRPTKNRLVTSAINDDEEERKQRRESMAATRQKRQSLAFGAVAGSLLGLETASISNKIKDLAVVEQEALPSFNIDKLSAEEIGKKYEEWMKIATDNKINSNNSWNVQLIDYFHELSLMREGDSINFTKASCTLDGCVKVYTNRVDAVATETNRLLSGLAENNSGKEAAQTSDDEQADSETEKSKVKKSRNYTRESVTVEKNPQSLNLRKFDLEFSADPLFKKTCADFDEGGAAGLLLGHLSLYGNGRLVFDASDIDTAKQEVCPDDAIHQRIDSADLLKLLGDNLKNLSLKTVCPSMRHFKFSDTATGLAKDLDTYMHGLNLDDLHIPELCPADFDNNADDMFEPLHDEDERSAGDESDIEPMLTTQIDHAPFEIGESAENHDFDDYHVEQVTEDQHEGEHVNFLSQDSADERPTVKRVPLSNASGIALSLSTENIYSYFDSTTLKNWAGPEHWRIHRTIPKKAIGVETEVKRPKKEKQTFFVDFFAVPVDQKSLFAKDKRSIQLPKSKVDTRATILPLDLHYSMKDFCSLFLKPKLNIVSRSPEATHDHWEVDIQGEEAPEFDNDEGGDFDEPVNFASQFDVYDDEEMTQKPAANWTSQMVAEPKHARVEGIAYAKKAKRVDIQKLKDNIWDNLAKPVVADADGETAADVSMESPLKRKFSDIMETVSQVYAPEKAKDISVSFYFICLLHLANEKNLKISGNEDLSDFTIIQNR